MQDDKLDLDKVLKKSHKLIPAASREANEIIALIGNTGCGKSTLLKFLTKDKSLKIIKNAQEQCIYVDSQKTIGGVGSESFESKTLLPNVVKDEESGCTIVDCAGFNDTRSSEMDFIASFMNNEYLQMAKRIKIVIVENGVNFDLNLNRDAFVKNLMQISLLLKFNFSLLKSSICIIANKVNSKFSDEKQIEFIQKFLEELKNFITKKCGKDADFEDDNCQRALQILSYLQDGCIGILRRPSEVTDDPLELDDLKQNHIDLRKLIFEKLQYADNACDKFNITVAPTTRLWINGSLIDESYIALKSSMNAIIEGLKKRVKEKLHNAQGKLKEKISNIILDGREIIATLENIKSEEDVISLSRTYSQPEEAEELNFCLRKLKFTYGVVGKEENEIKEFIVGLIDHRKILIEETANIVEFYEMMTDFVKETSRYDVLLKKDEILDRINSMSETNFQTELLTISGAINVNEKTANRVLNMKKISSAHLENLKWYLRNSFNDNLSISLENSSCTIRGKYIILSQQQEFLQKNRSRRRQIVLEATQVVFIDCDLTLESTHLVLVAPLIEIVNEKKAIKLLGENGAQHAETKAKSSKNDTSGENGLHGNPGFSSGNCKIIALNIINPQLLEIHSEGGNGSDGQDGGDGNSISCAIPVFQGYQVKSKIFETDEFLRNNRENFDNVEIEGVSKSTYKASEEPPIFDIRFENHPDLDEVEPSEGGRGGDAGQSAAAGDVEVCVKNRSAKNQVAIFRQDGKNGNAGKGGVGGEARGTYQIYKCSVSNNQRQQEEEVNPAAARNKLLSEIASTGTIVAISAINPFIGVAALTARALSSLTPSSVPSSKIISWKVKILFKGESGHYSCELLKSYDGADGHPAAGNSEQRLKFMDHLLTSEDIKQDFAVFSAVHGHDDEEDCQQLIHFWKF